MGDGNFAKRVIGGIYSHAAKNLYDPIVVNGAFKLFGGALNDLVLEQGREAVSTARGRPILDMPVGTGYFTLEIARRHEGVVVGVDIAEGMVREARLSAIREGLDNLVTTRADAHHLPFPDGAFGAILCSNGLQVIPGLTPTLAELVRVLAPGGNLYVSVINAPLGALVPSRSRDRLPTLLRPKGDIARALTLAGMPYVNFRHERLAAVYWATKPAAGQEGSWTRG